MHDLRSTLQTGLLGMLLAAVLATAAEACPGCKEALASQDPQAANVVRGYFWSILFMMSMPFLLIGSFSGYMVYKIRQARRAESMAKASSPAAEPAAQP